MNDDNENQLPASLARAHKCLPPRNEERVLAEQALEITFHGRLVDARVTENTLFVREREPWLDARGRVNRTYVFADGHSEIHNAASREEPEAWERERGVANP